MKTILAVIACVALFAACCEADTIVAQILWSGGALAFFLFCCKAYERFCMTDDEKNERV